MPELPEVETLRRSLEPDLLGRTILRATVRRRDMLVAPGDPPGGFSRSRSEQSPVPLRAGWMLEGMNINALMRRGKQLAIECGQAAIVIQLGMTGSACVVDAEADAPAHTHVLWRLENGRSLAFSDPRRFGCVRLLPDGTRALWAALGPDALSVRGSALAARLVRTARPIKAALLDQAVVAGVGNIYADEALFAARIPPALRADRLDAASSRVLAREIRRILRAAIERGGSTIRDYRDASGNAGGYQLVHKVYGRGGEPCRRCRTALAQSQVAQRTTVWCPRCQGDGSCYGA